ncbi:MAG TPA: ABC transporter permease, partial [Verrucomicrobiae bacterium]|nr:ABC transporter permease [Verrucomicrobiae bacterium]
LGARAVFALPVALPSNWIFRVTAVHRPSHYFRAVRNAVVVLAAGPICVAFAVVYFVCWPALPAMEHTLVLCAAALLMVSRSFDGFHKIPFACSYLPGKANINVKLGVYAILFIFCAEMGVQIEYWAIHSIVSFSIVFGLLLAVSLWAHKHWREFASSPYNQIQFEDLPIADVSPLDLHGSTGGGWTGGESAPPPAPPPSASFPTIARSSLLTLSSAETAPEPVTLGTHFEQFWTDVRHGARIFLRAPGFSAAAVCLFALGIGGNTAIYSVVHALASRPAPGIDVNGLVVLIPSLHQQPRDPGENSYPTYLDYAARTHTLQSLAAEGFSRFSVSLADGTWQLRGLRVTGNFLATAGVRVARGRDFTAGEAEGRAPLAAIIAWHVWQNQFHGAPDTVGRTITINGLPVTVVGITAAGFRGLEFAPHFELCVPLVAWARANGVEDQLRDPTRYGLGLIGRLNPDASRSQAQAELDAISRALERDDPLANYGRGFIASGVPATTFGPLGGAQSRIVRTLIAIVSLVVLLIVCANLANLVLSRVLARRRELAIRAALGASWMRIASMLAGEVAALSLVACAAALLATSWIMRIIGALAPPVESGARFATDLSPDWQVALYALALAVLCTAAVSVAPALRIWRSNLLAPLKRTSRLAGSFVVAQLACCVLLASGGVLAWRAVSAIDRDDVYIVRDHLLLAAINTSGSAEPDLLERIRARLLALPRVTSVSWALAAPPDSHSFKGVVVNGAVRTQGTLVGPEYLTTLGIHLLAGRDLTARDTAASAVINHKLAEALWPGQSAIGRTISTRTIVTWPVEVVGVAPDAPYSGVAEDGSYTGVGKADRPNFVFLPDDPRFRRPGQVTFHIRYTGSAGSLAADIRAAIHDVDRSLPVFSMRSMQEEWSNFTALLRHVGTLVQVFGIISLLLSAIGLYAVVNFQTATRTKEFGIRAALGARPREMLAAALRGAVPLAAVGVSAGLILVVAISRVAGALTLGFSPADPVSLAVVIGILLAVSFAACLVPAFRALRADPAAVLREE